VRNTQAVAPEQNDGFGSLGIDDALLNALNALGYEEPTAIQRETIPPLLAGRDVLGQAATGTGKTAAFALPMLQRIGRREGDRPIRGLILVPTRELAMQVAEAVHRYGKQFETRVLPIFGGQSIGLQLRGLRRGTDVVVATPGRALDLINRSALDLSGVEFLVLDEADEMLDMGFAEELDAILETLPEHRQTALFSATMAPRIRAITKKHLRDPLQVTIGAERTAPGKAPRVREVAYIVARPQKVAALARVLDIEDPASVIVFCRTRTEVDELTDTLGGRGYEAESLHGGLSQEQRDRVLRRFRENKIEILVATDVAARGLDIEHVSHVVNYDVPSSPDAYVHRIGRTGRAGREGVAVTFAEIREQRLLRNIEQYTKRKIAIENVPTVHDLRAKRLETVRASLETAVNDGDLERYRAIVDSLAAEYDIYDLAAAAAKLADQSREAGPEEDIEIPSAQPRESRKQKSERSSAGDVSRIYVGLGRRDQLRPADLVGAFANEAGINSRDIGAIDIADRFSLIEVPTSHVERIVKALRHTMVRGKKLGARRDRK
jgi:ATP-dependent RNA helicase DeaD